jgi:hypothetical protein
MCGGRGLLARSCVCQTLLHSRVYTCTAQVETIYKAEHGELEHTLAKADEAVTRFDDRLEKVCFSSERATVATVWGLTAFLTNLQPVQEELKAEAKMEQLEKKKSQLQALRALVDQNTRELAAARKQDMKDNLRRAAQARAAAAGDG